MKKRAPTKKKKVSSDVNRLETIRIIPPINSLVEARENVDNLKGDYLSEQNAVDFGAEVQELDFAQTEVAGNIATLSKLDSYPGRKTQSEGYPIRQLTSKTENSSRISKAKPYRQADDLILASEYASKAEPHILKPRFKKLVTRVKTSNFSTIAELAASIKETSMLDFTGIPTVTDATLAVLVSTMSASALKNIEGVLLAGCHLVTNRGIALMSRSFDNLELMDMTGCQRVTEAVFGPLILNCKKITLLKIAGTGIRSVPPRYIGYIQDTVQGCPLVSPTESTLQAKIDGKASKDIPQRRTDSMKVVVVRRNSVTTNLLQNLRKEPQNPQAVTVDTAYKIGSTVYPIVECQEGFLDLYVTPRTLYVITSDLSDDKNLADEAARIAAVICQVASKVGGECGFIVTLLDSEKVKAVSGNILKNKIMTTIGTIVGELKARTKTYKPKKLSLESDEDYQESEVHCRGYVLAGQSQHRVQGHHGHSQTNSLGTFRCRQECVQ
ncbi:uncharacterized protein LOC124273099 [Haliotis rubra]|uniref:uncharacterized protein LOC124273099 n=1 Tax=Haliotis rubra TaxID=36100 RepID=UPI001EE59177|nr:uncharacterized protein LOC124273099 [Haliotis rubra]